MGQGDCEIRSPDARKSPPHNDVNLWCLKGILAAITLIFLLFSLQVWTLGQAYTRSSIVRKRSLKMGGSLPRLGCFLPRGLGLMLGTMPRLKIALRLARQS
jgi:hypothetical protein